MRIGTVTSQSPDESRRVRRNPTVLDVLDELPCFVQREASGVVRAVTERFPVRSEIELDDHVDLQGGEGTIGNMESSLLAELGVVLLEFRPRSQLLRESLPRSPSNLLRDQSVQVGQDHSQQSQVVQEAYARYEVRHQVDG